MDYKKLTAPCGMDCFNCDIFADNINDEVRKRIAPYLNKDPENFQCEGCRISGCVFIPNECATKKCVESKGHEFCSDCNSFPCSKLQPCSDRAERLPHNIKLFNLCRIKASGIDEWTKETKTIRGKYFKGKIVIGAGPSLNDKE